MEIENLAYEIAQLKNDGKSFWFHITSRLNAQSIFTEGLFLDNNKITSTAQEVDDSFFNDPERYINFDLGNPQTRQKEIIIVIGCDNDELKYLIKNSQMPNEFYIEPEYIVGYIDIDTMYFSQNPQSLIEIDSYTL